MTVGPCGTEIILHMNVRWNLWWMDAGRSLRTDTGRWPHHTRTRTRTHNRSSITAHPNAECRALAELTSACAYDWRINVFERQTAV